MSPIPRRHEVRSAFWPVRRLAAVVLLQAFPSILAADAGSEAPAARTAPQVDIIQFSQNRPIPPYGDLANAATELLRLRVAGIPAVASTQVLASAPPCSAAASPGTLGEPKQPSGLVGALPGGYFAVSGYLEASPPSKSNQTSIFLSYRVVRKNGCESTPILRFSDSFRAGETYEALRQMADAVARRIERELATRIAVKLNDLRVAPRSPKFLRSVADQISALLRFRLEASDDIALVDPLGANRASGVFQVDGEIAASGSSHSSASAAFQLDFSITAPGGKTKALAPIKGRFSDLESVRFSGAMAVYRALLEARSELAAPNDSSPLDRARALLCLSDLESGACTADPKAALAALAPLAKTGPEDAERLRLEGLAYAGMGDNRAAAERFDAAIAQLPEDQSAMRTDLTEDAARAWSDADDHVKAGQRYYDLLRLVRERPTVEAVAETEDNIRVKYAENLLSAHEPLKALSTLLGAAASGKIPAGVAGSLKNLVQDLPLEQTDQALLQISAVLGPASAYEDSLLEVAASAALGANDNDRATQYYERLKKNRNGSLSSAEMYNGLGLAYYELGRYREAGPNFALAAETAAKDKSALYGTALYNLGVTERLLKDYSEAEKHLLQSLQQADTLAHRVSTVEELAKVYNRTERFPEAQALFDAQLKNLRESGPASAVAEMETACGGMYAEERSPLALGHYENALKAWTKPSGEYLPEASRVLNDIGAMLEGEGHYDRAAGYLERALKVSRADSDAKPDTLGLRLRNLAEVYVYLHRFDEADRLLREALALVGDRATADAAFLHEALGNLLRYDGRFSDAERELQRTIEIYRALPGYTGTPAMAGTMNVLGIVHKAQSKLDLAKNDLEESWAIRKEWYGPDQWVPAITESHLADALRLAGNFEESERMQLAAIKIRKATPNLNPEHLAVSMQYMGELMLDTNRFQEAEQNFREAVTYRLQAIAPEHPGIAYLNARIAESLRVQNRLDEADRLLAQSIPVLAKSEPKQEHYAAACETLALLRQQQGKLKEAESLFRTAMTILEASFPKEHPQDREHPEVAATRQHLAALLRQMDRSAEAQEIEKAVALLPH